MLWQPLLAPKSLVRTAVCLSALCFALVCQGSVVQHAPHLLAGLIYFRARSALLSLALPQHHLAMFLRRCVRAPCPDGWSGMGCNVCQAPTVCQPESSFVVATGNSSSGTVQELSGLNDTLTCNTTPVTPQVFAAGEMSCVVIVGVLFSAELLYANMAQNPTIQGLFPLSSTLTILHTLDTSLKPQPYSTFFGALGSAYVQLSRNYGYDGIEQLSCAANKCMQSVSDLKGATWTWSCSSLQCGEPSISLSTPQPSCLYRHLLALAALLPSPCHPQRVCRPQDA